MSTRALRTALAALYPNGRVARRVADDAGLDPSRIDFEGAADAVWFGVLEEATRSGKLDAVKAIAREEYPNNVALAALVPAPPPAAAPPAAVDFHRLTGAQYRQLQEALLDAFVSNADLAQFVRFSLDESLAAITSGGGLSQDVFNLIQWTQARGRTEELFRAALAARPGNAGLQAFAAGG